MPEQCVGFDVHMSNYERDFIYIVVCVIPLRWHTTTKQLYTWLRRNGRHYVRATSRLTRQRHVWSWKRCFCLQLLRNLYAISKSLWIRWHRREWFCLTLVVLSGGPLTAYIIHVVIAPRSANVALWGTEDWTGRMRKRFVSFRNNVSAQTPLVKQRY